jgi:hypothetical protein
MFISMILKFSLMPLLYQRREVDVESQDTSVSKSSSPLRRVPSLLSLRNASRSRPPTVPSQPMREAKGLLVP